MASGTAGRADSWVSEPGKVLGLESWGPVPRTGPGWVLWSAARDGARAQGVCPGPSRSGVGMPSLSPVLGVDSGVPAVRPASRGRGRRAPSCPSGSSGLSRSFRPAGQITAVPRRAGPPCPPLPALRCRAGVAQSPGTPAEKGPPAWWLKGDWKATDFHVTDEETEAGGWVTE